MFINFANFYQHFIQGFSKIAALLKSSLKITKLSKLAPKVFKADNYKVVDNDNSKTNKTVINLFKNNKFRNFIYISNIRVTRKPTFLTFNTKKVFNYL